MRGRWVGAVLSGLVLSGCGGAGPRGYLAPPAVKAVTPVSFAGGTGGVTFQLPAEGLNTSGGGGLAQPPAVVTATTTAADGTALPTQVTQTGNEVQVQAEFPPNLTTQAQSYTVTVTVQQGELTVTQTQTVSVPGLDAPAPGGTTPPVDGPAGPDLPEFRR